MLYSRRHTQPLFPEAATGDDERGSLDRQTDGRGRADARTVAPRGAKEFQRRGNPKGIGGRRGRRLSSRLESFLRATPLSKVTMAAGDGLKLRERWEDNVANQPLQIRLEWPVCRLWRNEITVRPERIFLAWQQIKRPL